MKKIMAVMLVTMIMIMCLSGCGGSGGPYTVTFGELQIQPGVTTMQEAEDAGYGFNDLMGGNLVREEDGSFSTAYTKVLDLNAEAEANTVYTGLVMIKDEQRVAIITIVNESAKNAPLKECKISAVTVSFDDYEVEKAAIEGVAFDNISGETLAEVLGEAKKTPNYGYEYSWARGKYSLDIKYQEDGSLESVRSDYNEF